MNIISEVPISITEAVLGCKVTIETIEGKISIDVKPGTSSGQEFVLRHHGMPPFHPPDNYDVNQLRGDHIVRFKVVIPSTMSEEQERIMNDFRRREQASRDRFY